MHEFKADDSDNDEHNGEKPDNMCRIAEKNNSCHNGSRRADARPDGVSSSDRDAFHRLRDGKKAHHNENYGDNAGDNLCKPLAVFQRDGEANLKKPGK